MSTWRGLVMGRTSAGVADGRSKTCLDSILSVPFGTRCYPHALDFLFDGLASARPDAVFVEVHHRWDRSGGRWWTGARLIKLLGNLASETFLNQVALLVFDL